MTFIETLLALVQELVNGIFASLNEFFAILGIDAQLDPVDMDQDL